MGESKRRSGEIAQLKAEANAWRVGLSDEARLIAHVAERLDERLVRARRFSEGCYHLAFFMTRYLSLHGVQVRPIIGWVNDGTWQGMTSHAWIEFEGKKTDASLGYTSHPDAQPTGALIIHDRVMRTGMVDYNYYKNDDCAVQVGLDWMQGVPEFRSVLRHKEAEHAEMMVIASEDRIDTYLSKAPHGTTFADLARLVEA